MKATNTQQYNEAIKALKRASKALYDSRRALAAHAPPDNSITRIAIMQAEVCSLLASLTEQSANDGIN